MESGAGSSAIVADMATTSTPMIPPTTTSLFDSGLSTSVPCAPRHDEVGARAHREEDGREYDRGRR